MSAATIPAPAPTTPLMTAEQFLAKHGDDRYVELVNGHVVEIPMPGSPHGRICSKANYFFAKYEIEAGLGRVLSHDTFVQTKDDPVAVRGADLIYLSYARLSKDQPIPTPCPSPDLIVEVRSPTDRLKQLIKKADEYLDAGVAVVVLLFPESKSAAIHRPNAEPVSLSTTETLELPDILPGFSVPVKAFFA